MATAMPIADARYLWSEVDRLKSQVAELQATERRVSEDQAHIRDYVASFVTHAQLDAALCTKISQASVSASVDKLRVELLAALNAKAECESVQTLQAKKLDISVYEAATWDLKKLRGALEQSLHDMFAAFAHQIENQVSSKVSLADFNQIFNPDANGQKQAIESAATRLSRMTDQLESLQEYVSADRLRQHKVADLNVSVLDLTRKHNASRNAVAQLISSSESLKEKMEALASGEQQLASHVTELSESLQQLREASEREKVHQEHQHQHMTQEVAGLQTLSKQMVQSLEQIQHFTRDTLLKSFDVKLKQLRGDLRLELDGLSVAQKQQAQLVHMQLSKASDKLQHHVEQIALLDSRLRALGTRLCTVNDELEAVKGPLATLAANLREENATILVEIQRSQNESREIMLDYQELLEKEQTLVAQASFSVIHPPSRPSSSAAMAGAGAMRAASAYTSRKHKQQVLAMGRSGNNSSALRPQISPSSAARAPPPSRGSDSIGEPRDNSNNNAINPMQTKVSSSVRAQTAGATPKKKNARASSGVYATNNSNNLPDIDPTDPPSSRRRSLFASLDSGRDEDSPSPATATAEAEPLFHFPMSAAAKAPPSSSSSVTSTKFIAAASPETEVLSG